LQRQNDETIMRRLIFIIIILSIIPLTHSKFYKKEGKLSMPELPETWKLYSEIQLDSVIDYELFEQAITGYNKIEDKKKEIITLIDYSRPSNEERLFVIDLKNKELLYKSLVAHGRNSGSLYATSFSNKNGSYKSSLGFFLTENTYQGKNGYSLVLDGLEKGINDMAKARAIVMHAASYSSNASIKSTGQLGRSLGCPALPKEVSKDIINLIKGGSLVYIYADDPNYFAESTIISPEEHEDFGKHIG